MLISKNGISREIDEKDFFAFKEKGYNKVISKEEIVNELEEIETVFDAVESKFQQDIMNEAAEEKPREEHMDQDKDTAVETKPSTANEITESEMGTDTVAGAENGAVVVIGTGKTEQTKETKSVKKAESKKAKSEG